MIRSVMLAAISTIMLGSVAMAADLPSEKGPPVYAPPPPPAFSWTGFYIGAQVGYGWGRVTELQTAPGVAPGPNIYPSGLVGGGHIGYNYQISQFVFGLEGDANGSTERGSAPVPGAGTTAFERKLFDASIRGRAGIAFDRFLVYATGGGAYGDFRAGISGGGAGSVASYFDHFGWTVGGGVEYAIDTNWSVRAEYRYTNYGAANANFVIPGVAVATIRYHVTDNRVQAGFSYRFGDVPPPAPPVAAKY